MRIIVVLEQERVHGRQYIILFQLQFIMKPLLLKVIKLLELMVLIIREIVNIQFQSMGLQLILKDHLLIIQQASHIKFTIISQLI